MTKFQTLKLPNRPWLSWKPSGTSIVQQVDANLRTGSHAGRKVIAVSQASCRRRNLQGALRAAPIENFFKAELLTQLLTELCSLGESYLAKRCVLDLLKSLHVSSRLFMSLHVSLSLVRKLPV